MPSRFERFTIYKPPALPEVADSSGGALTKVQEMGQLRRIDTIRRHLPFEEVMITDEMHYETWALHVLASFQVRDQPVNRAMANA